METQLARNTIVAGAIMSFLAVAIGAFGAHMLAPILIENGRVATFETASQYHFYHALALLFIGVLHLVVNLNPDKKQSLNSLFRWAAITMFAGIMVFSGSLYCLSLSNISWLGAVTPLGGILLLCAWLFVCKIALSIGK